MVKLQLIKYKYAFEHPVGKGFSLFFGLVFAFFAYVNVMNLGFYGYVMDAGSMWFLLTGFVYFGFEVRYGKLKDAWRKEIRWYGLKVAAENYQDVKVIEDGKIFRLAFYKHHKFLPSSVVFNKKQLDFFNLVFPK